MSVRALTFQDRRIPFGCTTRDYPSLETDESFRVESKAYPRLHQVGSDTEYDLYRKDQLFSDGLDPTKEENYALIAGITREMSALFPDEYFHMGGDEVNYTAWLDNPDITAFMQAKGFEQPQDLQAYFIKRYYDMIRARGYYLDLMQTAYAHHQRDPVDMRNWPRAGAIAERFWSPRKLADEVKPDGLYPRLFALSDHLEAVGLTHRSHMPDAMKTLAGPGGNSEALQVLASEHNNAEYSMIFAYVTGLTWFVDFPEASYAVERFLEHIPPESETAWWFNHRIDQLLAGTLPDAEVDTLRQQLRRWRDNHRSLEATIASSDTLKGDGLDHSTETESEYFVSNLFKPRGLRLHVVPIQRGVAKLLLEAQSL